MNVYRIWTLQWLLQWCWCIWEGWTWDELVAWTMKGSRKNNLNRMASDITSTIDFLNKCHLWINIHLHSIICCYIILQQLPSLFSISWIQGHRSHNRIQTIQDRQPWQPWQLFHVHEILQEQVRMTFKGDATASFDSACLAVAETRQVDFFVMNCSSAHSGDRKIEEWIRFLERLHIFYVEIGRVDDLLRLLIWKRWVRYCVWWRGGGAGGGSIDSNINTITNNVSTVASAHDVSRSNRSATSCLLALVKSSVRWVKLYTIILLCDCRLWLVLLQNSGQFFWI